MLTSSPLPAGTPDHVTAGLTGPADLLDQLRSRPSGGDVHLVGGPQTIRAFHALGALDRLELVVLPTLLGEGRPLSPAAAPPMPLTLLRSDRTFPDGSIELAYQPSSAAQGQGAVRTSCAGAGPAPGALAGPDPRFNRPSRPARMCSFRPAVSVTPAHPARTPPGRRSIRVAGVRAVCAGVTDEAGEDASARRP